MNYMSKSGHVLLAKHAQREMLRAIKRNLFAIAACNRGVRDRQLAAARKAM